MPATLRRIESLAPRKAQAFGGKAKNLAALARAGFPVPAAYALDAQAAEEHFRAALPPEDRPAALLRQPSSKVDDARLEAIAVRIEEAPVPEAVALLLTEALQALLAEGAQAVVVRSSATHEDHETSSSAGIHETILGVTDEEALLRAARACWASLARPRAVRYLRTVGGLDAGIGLVLQALVPADVAGALFTVNPLSGDPREMLINASYGLGTLVMDGGVSPDTFRVDKSSGAVRDRVLGEKAESCELVDGRVVRRPVGAARRAAPAIDDATLDELVGLGRSVEDHFASPRDVEWAIAEGRVFLLQARPVTALPEPAKGSRARSDRDRSGLVWSNVNVGEALPGVASPITWSVLSEFSERGFRQAFGALGCRVPKDAELVGCFRGRIYLNLTEFMEIASQVPGVRPSMLLALAGGGEAELLDAQIESPGSAGFLMRLPLTVTRYARANLGLKERVSRFEGSFAEEYGRLRGLDLRVLSASGLDRVLIRVEGLLDRTGRVMLNVYGNLLAAVLALRGLLASVMRGASQEERDRVERDLLTGLDDVESADPGLALWHIADTAGREPEAREALLGGEAHDLRVADLPEGPTRRALERFLGQYGDRGTREAEIAEPRWAESPGLLFATLRGHLSRRTQGHDPAPTPEELERRLRGLREEAQRRLEARTPRPARAAARGLIAFVQRYTRLRERLRGHTVAVLGLYRRVALDASRRLHVMEPSAGTDAAFYLSVGELHAVLRGDANGVAPLVRRRRLQLQRDRALPSPPDTFVGSPPPPSALEVEDELRGLPACAGIVRGPARVLKSPSDADALVSGEILVAPTCDVGASPLFLVAAAVVTDLGGPLSHAAVVAREYGVPMVVNAKRASLTIRTGDLLEVDGGEGVVRVLSRAEA